MVIQRIDVLFRKHVCNVFCISVSAMSVLIADHIVLVSEVGRVRQGISYRNRSQMSFFSFLFLPKNKNLRFVDSVWVSTGSRWVESLPAWLRCVCRSPSGRWFGGSTLGVAKRGGYDDAKSLPVGVPTQYEDWSKVKVQLEG